MIVIGAGKRKGLVGALVAASLGQAALAVVGAYCVQNVFDTLLANGAGRPQFAIAGLFAFSAACAAILEVYRSWAGEKLGLGFVAEVREALFARIMSASAATLSQKRQGGLLLPFVGDLTAIKKWVSDGLVRLISASVTFVILLGVLATRSLTLGAAVGLVVLMASLAVIWLSGPLSAAIRDVRRRRGAVANFVSSSIRAVRTVQAFDRLAREAARLGKRSDALMAAGLRLAAVSGATTALIHLAGAALIGVTLAVGVIEVRSGAMSIGAVAGAISIAGLLASAVRDLGLAFEVWRRAQVSFTKVAAALELAPSLAGRRGGKAPRAEGAGIALESVTVAGAFSNISATAPPGAVVNVVGPSGSGKSTLLALVARLRDPDTGRVRLNGRDLRRISVSQLRRRIGVASAAMPLMRGSLAMNLRYRAMDASQSEIERVIDACNLRPLLARLPDGLQSRLGEGAQELSIGETQRLLIARAMVGAPPILILDDVDSHLDTETVMRLAAVLKAYDGTVLMAATNPVWRGLADYTWRIARDQDELDKSETGLHAVATSLEEPPGPASRVAS